MQTAVSHGHLAIETGYHASGGGSRAPSASMADVATGGSGTTSTSRQPGRRARERGLQYDHLIKLLLLGDSAVGKSSLLLRFCEDKFRSAHVLTIGVDFKSKIVDADGEKVKLQIWDTAGQERFRNITPVYFRSAMGVVLVYDVTKKESFENIRFWIKNLDEHATKDVVKVLVGNKVDLEEYRAVTRAMGAKLAAEYKMPFFETSAKSNLSIEEAFVETACRVRQTQREGLEAVALAESVPGRITLDSEKQTEEDTHKTASNNCCGLMPNKKRSKGSSSEDR